jgi:HEAT repeat protein
MAQAVLLLLGLLLLLGISTRKRPAKRPAKDEKAGPKNSEAAANSTTLDNGDAGISTSSRVSQEPVEREATGEYSRVIAEETPASALTSEVSAAPELEKPTMSASIVWSEKAIAQLAGDSDISGELLQRLNSSSSVDRSAALTDLAELGGADAFRLITCAFDDQVADVRNAAARALYTFQSDCAASFTRALKEGTPDRRRKIGAALASSGLASEAIANLTAESGATTYDAFSLLFLMAKAGEVQPLMKAIEDDPNLEVRLAVVKLLALSGQREIIPALRRLVVRGSFPSEVRSAVMEAIYQIGNQTSDPAPSAQ